VGKRGRRAVALANYAAGTEKLREAVGRTQQSEDIRGQMEAMLGTTAQRQGTGQFQDYDPALRDYLGRYSVDTEYRQAYQEAMGGLPGSADPWTSYGIQKKKKKGFFSSGVGMALGMVAGFAIGGPLGASLAGALGGGATAGAIGSYIGKVAVQQGLKALTPGGTTYSQAANQGDRFRGGLDLGSYWNQKLGDVNTLLDEAEIAARAGDTERAQELKKKADEVLGGYPSMVQKAFNDQRNINQEAVMNVSNPMARIVGNKIGRGLELQDRESDEYQATFGDLTDLSIEAIRHRVASGERSIASEQRQIERNTRDTFLKRGGARNPVAEAAIMARASDQAAFRRAQLQSNAAIAQADVLAQGKSFLESFRQKYAGDAVQLGRAFTATTPGVRDQFNETLNNLAQAESDSLEHLGDQWWASYQAYEQRKALQKAANLEAAGAAIGAVAGAVGTYFASK